MALELFDEAAKQDLVPDPSDILVERRGSAVRPLNQRLAEDLWDNISSIENKTKLPRTILKNGKRSKVDLDKSRRASSRDSASSNLLPSNSPPAPLLSIEHLTQSVSSPLALHSQTILNNSVANSFMAREINLLLSNK